MPICVGLISTSPPGLLGSMANYAALVADALRRRDEFEPVPIPVAMPQARLAGLPSGLRNYAHHAAVVCLSRTRANRRDVDLFHILDGSHAYLARFLSGRPTMVTCHDLIPLLQTQRRFDGQTPSWAGRRLIRASLGALFGADGVVTDSAATRTDLLANSRVAPDRVRVLPLPVPGAILAAADRLPRRAWAVRRDDPHAYVLHVGNNAVYKNRTGVLRIFQKIATRCDIRLKMAGPAPPAALRQLAAELGVSERVEFVLDPDDAALCELYRNACLLLFPSRYEGFGLPPLEAMSFDCPVVCSDAASLPEVVGDAALLAPATAEAELAGHCLRVLNDAGLAEEMIQRGQCQAAKFSLERFTQGLVEAYRWALERRQ